MKKTILSACHAFTPAAKWARGLALAFGLCLAAALSAPAQAQVFILPADEPYFELWEYDLGSAPGGWTATFTSSRELTYVSAYTADWVEYHLHADSGDGGAAYKMYVGNMISLKTWSHGFTIRYFTHPSESIDGCCWPDTNTGEWVGYHEDTWYTSFLWADVGFAPGADPIELTLSHASVPEPATWAMMIIGFGLAGSSVRRSRRQSLALAS